MKSHANLKDLPVGSAKGLKVRKTPDFLQDRKKPDTEVVPSIVYK